MADSILIRDESYDSTTGCFSREIRANNFSNLCVIDATPTAGVTTLTGSIVIPANQIGLIISYDFAGDAAAQYHVSVVGSSTRRVLHTYVSNTSARLMGSIYSPLVICESSSTITQVVAGAGSTEVSASLSVILVPNKDQLETE